MKSKKQIEKFLESYRPANDSTKVAMKYLLKGEYGIILRHDDEEGKTPIDLPEFMNWLESGFSSGDMVEWTEDGGIKGGIVVSSDVSKVQIAPITALTGSTIDVMSFDVTSITPASQGVSTAIFSRLKEINLQFNAEEMKFVECFIPKNGNLVEYVHQSTGKKGYGIVQIVTPDNDVVMFCCGYIGEELKYKKPETIGKLDEFIFTPSQNHLYPRKYIDRLLAKEDKRWNDHQKRIEPINLRCKNETYWFITENFSVTSAIDNGAMKHKEHYWSGNYFTTEKEALECVGIITNFRRSQMSE